MGKRLWQSRTVGVNLCIIAGVLILSQFWPGFHAAMCGDVDKALAILGAINIFLRLITREPVT